MVTEQFDFIIEETLDYWIKNVPGMQPHIFHDLFGKKILQWYPNSRSKGKQSKQMMVRDYDLAQALFVGGYYEVYRQLADFTGRNYMDAAELLGKAIVATTYISPDDETVELSNFPDKDDDSGNTSQNELESDLTQSLALNQFCNESQLIELLESARQAIELHTEEQLYGGANIEDIRKSVVKVILPQINSMNKLFMDYLINAYMLILAREGINPIPPDASNPNDYDGPNNPDNSGK